MNIDFATKVISEIELEVAVEEIKFGDLQVWPHIKASIFFALLNPEKVRANSGGIGDSTKNSGRTTIQFIYRILRLPLTVARYLSSLLKIRRHFNSLREFIGTEVLFVIETDLGFTDVIEGKRYSRYLDPYFEVLSKHYKSEYLHVSFEEQKDDKLLNIRRVCIKDFIYVAQLKENFKRLIGAKRDKQILNFDPILKILSQYGVETSLNYYGLIGQLREVEILQLYYKKMLEIIAPKIVVETCYYLHMHIYALNYAAKINGVPTLEIQHGISEGIFYQTKDKDSNIYPDFFWVWSEYDKNTILRGRSTGEKLVPVVGGNLWYRKCLTDRMVGCAGDSFINYCNEYRKVILITLQHSMDIPDFISETIRTTSENWLWLIRFHPRTPQVDMDKYTKYFTELGKDNVEIEISTKYNLYGLLQLADVHITSHSAVAIEAVTFKVPTILINLQTDSLFSEMIKDGNCYVAKDAVQLTRLLKSNIKINEDRFNYYYMGGKNQLASELVEKLTISNN